MKFSLGKKLFLFFMVIVMALSTIAYILLQKNKIQQEKQSLVVQTHEVLGHSKEILALLGQIVSSSRAYAITGDSIFLHGSVEDGIGLTKNIVQLKEISTDNIDHKKLDTLLELARKRIAVSNSIIETRNLKGARAAQQIISAGAGEQLRREMTRIVHEIQLREKETLNRFEQESDKSLAAFNRNFYFLLILIILVVAAAFIVSVTQLRKRKQAEAELFLQHEWFSQTLLSLGDAVITTDSHGNITFMNKAAVELSGWNQEEAKGKYIEDVFRITNEITRLKVDNPALVAMLQNKVAFLSNHTILTRKDGSQLFIDDSGAPIHNISGKIIGGVLIFRNVTEKKIAQDEITKLNKILQHGIEEKTRELIGKELHFRNTLDNLFEGLQIIDRDFRYFYVNKVVASQGKYSVEELTGHKMTEKYPGIENTELFSILKKCMSDGTTHTMENKFTYPDNSIGWFELKIQPVPEGLLILSADISARKTAEMKLQAQNVQLKKMNEELDQFVYSASHDLRSPLSSLLGLIEITKTGTAGDDPELSTRLTMMDGMVRKLDHVITEIIHYSQNTHFDIAKDEISFKDLLMLVREDLKDLDGTAGYKFKTEITENGKFVSDKNRLSIILKNLISNAIRFQDKSKANPFVNIIINAGPENAHIIIEDNGIGIAQRDHQQIFNMFYRGSNQSKGPGLGLYVVKEVIEKLNGTIKVESEITEGSRFIVTIPNLA